MAETPSKMDAFALTVWGVTLPDRLAIIAPKLFSGLFASAVTSKIACRKPL